MAERRSSAIARIVLAILITLGPPAGLFALRAVVLTGMSGEATKTLLLPIVPWICASLFIVPAALLLPRHPPPPEPPEPGDGGGGGGPPRSDPQPPAPRGDVPLPDAEQSPVRRRDHLRPRLRSTARRGGRSPAWRSPSRRSPSRRSPSRRRAPRSAR